MVAERVVPEKAKVNDPNKAAGEGRFKFIRNRYIKIAPIRIRIVVSKDKAERGSESRR